MAYAAVISTLSVPVYGNPCTRGAVVRQFGEINIYADLYKYLYAVLFV